MKPVIVDSSFLMAVAEKPTDWVHQIVDLIGGFEPVMLQAVKSELAVLADGPGKKSRLARVSISVSTSYRLVETGDADVDSEIVSAALTAKAAVATIDGVLTSRLRSLNVQVLGLKGGRVAIV